MKTSVDQDLSILDAAQAFGITEERLKAWLKKFYKESNAGTIITNVNEQEIKTIRHEVETLKKDVEGLRKIIRKSFVEKHLNV